MIDRGGIIKLTLIAFVSAALALVLFVLPAEYGIDPVGSGEWLGLTALAEPSGQVVRPSDNDVISDTASFTLAPWESLEYKYEVPPGGSLVYRWQATSPVVFEFHGEPAAGPEGFAETWTRGEAASGGGTALLPFAGRHGWFWENRSFDTVTVRLVASGHIERMFTYRDGFIDEQVPAASAGDRMATPP